MARVNGYMAFVFLSFVLTAVQAAVMYNMDNSATFDNGKYKLYWVYKPTEERVYFKVKVNTTGWVGLGFSDKKGGMQNLDCVVGGVNDTMGYIMDLKATATAKPPKDPDQNYNLTSSSETDGKTTIEFNRKMDTGDDKDMKFMPGTGVYVAWAYKAGEDAPTWADLMKHSDKGYGSETLMFVPPPSTNMSTTTMTSATKSQGSRVNVWFPGIFLLFVLLSLFQ